jgi:hypothetical protein
MDKNILYFCGIAKIQRAARVIKKTRQYPFQ